MNLHAQNVRRTAGAFAVTAAAAGLVLTGCGKSSGSSAAAGSTAAATSAAATSGASSASASAAATSSASQSSVVVGSTGSLPFPDTVGDTWKYTNTNGTSSENKIISATPVSSGTQVAMETWFIDGGSKTPLTLDYIIQPNGEIALPTNEFTSAFANTGVTFKILSGGIFWPSAAELSSGQPVHTELVMQISLSGQKQTITEHITSQGQGTQSVTVPAGTYNATVVSVTETASIDGYNTVIDDKTWLASGVGPVKSELISVDGGKDDITSNQTLVSFTQG
jgi:hypothetical protein